MARVTLRDRRRTLRHVVSVDDVAAYILSRKGPMSAMKLQKLVYYCQAWSLVWDDAPLFREPIEAWANGPVCPPLWERHRGRFELSAPWRSPAVWTWVVAPGTRTVRIQETGPQPAHRWVVQRLK